MGKARDLLKARHPAQLLVLAFIVADLVATGLLMLPVSSASGAWTPFVDALFTATSAICVTGLVVVDTGTYWTGFGQVVILALMQLGGLGITVFASLLALLVSRKLGLRSRMIAAAETGQDLGSVSGLLKRIALFSLAFEAVGFVLLATLFRFDGADREIGDALWQSLFHTVSAYNNAGFSTNADSLVGYQGNPAVLTLISCLVVLGGIGYPVLSDIWQTRKGKRRWSSWTLHTRITLSTTLVLILAGMLVVLVLEWSNPDTLGGLGPLDRWFNALFGSVTPRTAGFNSIDYGQVREPTLLFTEALMLIGGGSGSAAGGIKVTTFALLGYVIWAELRGEPEVNVFGRRVPNSAQREALSVALLGVGAVIFGAFVLGAVSDYEEGEILFEAVSALGTVGLSTGITAELPTLGRVILIGLMLMGRLGPLTFGTAFVLRSRDRLYRYPEGRPLIG